MPKNIIFLTFSFIFSLSAFSQGVFDAPFPKLNRKPETLRTIREADVLWATRLWQRIDLRQPINKSLYSPLDSVKLGKRSLFQILLSDIIYDTSSNILMYKQDELNHKFTKTEVIQIIERKDTIELIDENGNKEELVFLLPLRTVKATMYKIDLMLDFFYNRQSSQMESRILSLGIHIPYYILNPDLKLIHDTANMDIYQRTDSTILIWFYYPSLRHLFANNPCYRNYRTGEILSIDQVFIKGLYSSIIFQKENVYAKEVNQYTTGLDALLEERRIKNQVFNKELNLWQY